jgi:hypothetical protein
LIDPTGMTGNFSCSECQRGTAAIVDSQSLAGLFLEAFYLTHFLQIAT